MPEKRYGGPRAPFHRRYGREPAVPPTWPEGSAEFAHRGRRYRVETRAGKAHLFAEDEEGQWIWRGQAESRARLVDLVTAETGRYQWSRGENLPEPVDRLLRGEQGHD